MYASMYIYIYIYIYTYLYVYMHTFFQLDHIAKLTLLREEAPEQLENVGVKMVQAAGLARILVIVR